MSEKNEIIIKDGTVAIEENAFTGCVGLKSITIPDSIKRIGNDAFTGCSNLENIKIPDNVVSIIGNIFEETAWYKNQANGQRNSGT